MKKNKMIIGIGGLLVICICSFFVFFSEDRKNSVEEGAIEKNEKKDIIEEDIVLSEDGMEAILGIDRDEEPYYDLSGEGELESDAIVQNEEIFMIQNKFKTNSTKITVANQGNIPIIVYLYNTLYPESTIQEMNIEPLENGIFSNLSVKYLYSIGIVAEKNKQIKISIND